jgi:uncharacterized membrane protein
MKLTDIILLSLSAAFVVVGTHLTMTYGVSVSYPVFMAAVGLILWYRYRKLFNIDKKSPQPNLSSKNKKRKK